MIESIKTEVLVVGGGGAASRAAIEAHMAGAKVTLAVKGRYGFMGIRGGGASDGSAIGRLDYAYFSYIDHLDKTRMARRSDRSCHSLYEAGGVWELQTRSLSRFSSKMQYQLLRIWIDGVLYSKTSGSKSAPRRFKPMPGLGYLG